MEYVIGIDSGGTHFRVMAADLQGNPLGMYVGEPANHYYVPEEEMMRRVNMYIDECLGQFDGSRKDCRFLVVGTTGLDSDADEALLCRLYGTLPDVRCPVRVMNDAELAHYTVTNGRGVLVISGTGSIAFARDQEGNTARAGGWMFSILGDEGSGTWVSKRALRQLARWFDGAAAEGPLIQSLQETLHIHNRSDLNELGISMCRPPWPTPQLGKLVNEAAERGDRDADQILYEAAVEILHIVEDVVCALDLQTKEPDFVLGVWGSNIVKSQRLYNHFCTLAQKRFPQVRIVRPQRSAMEGAVCMACELLRA